MPTSATDWIIPDWPAPSGVHAVSTTRLGGVSLGPYTSLNLGDHVGDDPLMVQRNRQILTEALQLPAEPLWLQQVHGCDVVETGLPGAECQADASVSSQPGEICVVMTADCLPVLFCDRQGRRVAAAHAGWRGLAAGVLESTAKAMKVPAADIMAWLGPAIGPAAFEVGEDVRQVFVEQDENAAAAFVRGRQGHWLADIYALARQRLQGCGITAVYGGGLCTWSEPERFYSYRRDGVTGRMASLVWLQDSEEQE